MNQPENQPGGGPDGSDRRASPRCAVLISGKAYQLGRVIDCVVSNVSAGGAKLLLPGPASDQLPDPTARSPVTLTIPSIGALSGFARRR